MFITDLYNIDMIIRELEAALQVDGKDYQERDIDVVITSVKKRIGRQYNIDLSDGKVTDESLSLSVYKQAVVVFLENMTRLHGSLCGYGELMRFHTKVEISLSEVNYLGFEQESLELALVAMQRKVTLPRTDDAVQSIKVKLGTINNCREKRMFLLLVICHEIGLDELVACIAEILYQGGRMQ